MESTGIPYGDIIIIGAIAAFILLRYRAILGEKKGFDFSDDPRTKPRNGEEAANDKVIELPGRAKEKPKKLPEELLPYKSDIAIFRAADERFDIEEFLTGAQAAFEMVFTAFNEGDRETLDMLLSKELAQTFKQAIDAREEANHTAKNTLVSLQETRIEHMTYRKPNGVISVAFESEQIHATYDDEGKLIEGDASEVVTVNDEWEFKRNMLSNSPNWTIIDT